MCFNKRLDCLVRREKKLQTVQMIVSHQMWRNVKPRICQVVSKQKGDYSSYSTGPNEGWLRSLSLPFSLSFCVCMRAHVCAQVHMCVCCSMKKKKAVITALPPLAPYNAFFCRVWSFRHWTGCFLFFCSILLPTSNSNMLILWKKLWIHSMWKSHHCRHLQLWREHDVLFH